MAGVTHLYRASWLWQTLVSRVHISAYVHLLAHSKKSVYICASLIFQTKWLGTYVHAPSSIQLISLVLNRWTQHRWGRSEQTINLQILAQQLDGDVKVCKPWKQERFRGPDDVAKMLGVVVSVVVATLLDERIPQTRPHKPAAKRQRRLCCLILLQTNPCAGLQ